MGQGSGKETEVVKAQRLRKEEEEAELQRKLVKEGEKERDKEAALSEQFKVW
jgi:hypothetical protein